MHRALNELLSHTGVISRRDYPELAGQIDVSLRRKEIVALLPGVYAPSEIADRWQTLAAAVPIWSRDATIVGTAAAALTFWPELTPTVVEVASRRRAGHHPRIRLTRRVIPPAMTVMLARATIARPELTALDLVAQFGGDAIDRALRSRMVTVDAMHRALQLTPDRVGNVERKRLLLDSRDEPWSALERLAHRHMRAAGIHRWKANVPIVCDGFTFHQDVAMTDSPLSIEFDGTIHLEPKYFNSDRFRGNQLLLAGRDVLHFTWHMVHDEPDGFISTLRRAQARYGIVVDM